MSELSCQQTDDLAAAWAVGALDGTQEEALARHLRDCERDHDEARSLIAVAAVLPASAEPVAPRLALRERIMASVAETPQIPVAAPVIGASPPQETIHGKRVGGGWLAWLQPGLARGMALAAIPIVVLLAVLALNLQGRIADQDQALRQVAGVIARGGDLVRVEGAAGRGYLVRTDGGATLLAADLAPLSDGRLYEMWVIDASGAAAPAGTFRPQANAVVVADLQAGLTGAKTFAVTVERQRVDKPTSDPVLAVNLAQ